MKDSPRRIVLAIYPTSEDVPEGTLSVLRAAVQGETSQFGPKNDVNPRGGTAHRYSALRLEGEVFLTAEASPQEVESALQRLLSAGSPAVFVLPLEASAAPATSRKSPLDVKLSFLARLREDEAVMESAGRDLAEAVRLGHALTAAAEWFLDNSYLIRAQIAEVRRNLPSSRSLSSVALLPGYELAKQLVSVSANVLSESGISDWLRKCQTTRQLIAELWLFPLLLRLALLEALKDLAGRVIRTQQMREAAYFWANRLAAGARRGPEIFTAILKRMEDESISAEPYFAMSLLEQLHDQEDALAPIQSWIEERLKIPVTDLVRNEHTQEAAERILTANAFGSLRLLPRIDFTKVFEAVSLVEAELRADPTYALSDFTTRDRCRRVVERISRQGGGSELEVARQAVKLAAAGTDPKTSHTAYYLLADGVTELEAVTGARIPWKTRFVRTLRRYASGTYLSSFALLTLGFLTAALILAWEVGVGHPITLAVLGVLALFPLSELSLQIVNALVISLLPPDPLPKMDFEHGIPAENATLVVVPMMLVHLEGVAQEVEKMEVRFLANREKNLFFALLSDYLDYEEPTAPSDAELLEAAKSGIARLNARYPGGRFLLFHRKRVWSDSEQLWIGRERKRGKIEDLNEFLCGGGAGEILVAGSLPLQIAYVITLDSDTQLPPDTARRMIETIAHPLNRVEIEPERRIRLRGFAIIQPRVSIALPGAIATRFTRIFADTSGTDPYCQTVSDAQQDLFGEAIFHGKAIYNVRAFRTILETRFPAETLLSHDLIEGAHAGVGLASDIELFENLPRDYASFVKRQHRWIRGDWQIAPWIFGRVPSASGGKEKNPLKMLDRWRILDNLRRSLVPVASLALLLFGWLISPAPGIWSLVVGLAVAIPAAAPLLDRLARRAQNSTQSWRGAADELVRAAIMIAFLPHQAWLSIDAIARVAYRRRFSRRKLLEWLPADHVTDGGVSRVDTTQLQVWVISGVSVLLMLIVGVKGALAPTSLFLGLWFISPLILVWISSPVVEASGASLDQTGTLFLRRLARRTWRYFDDLVNGDSNWLPPDNSQLALRVEVAQRTSPTNVGLWLTAAMAATDFGYLTVDGFRKRCAETFSTIARLESYEGHLLNWYDTRTLQPLMPRYVSTVDSGNLLACLWVFERGCQDQLDTPLIGAGCLRGLVDTLAALRELGGRDPSLGMATQAFRQLLRGRTEVHLLIGRLRVAAGSIEQLQTVAQWQDTDGERAYWISRLSGELNAWTELIDRYLPWIETLTQPSDSLLRTLGEDAVRVRRAALLKAPSLNSLANGEAGSPGPMETILGWREQTGLRPEVRSWLDQLAAEYGRAQSNARDTIGRMQELSQAAAELSAGINMRFLYDEGRRLFGIGYVVGGPVEFSSHYDLLASECRLASLAAIAKGDLPVEHWFALGRPLATTARGPALLSWSGTMFEYLTPLLFTRTFTNSLLDHACREAVRLQVEYGHDWDVPWGISESAYSAIDTHQIYQYRAFGIPALSLKPGVDDLVVAPYASVLALSIDPHGAIENLRRLQSLDLDGPMGFYESIDFSRESRPDSKPGVIIYTYMAHHQAMSLVALDNALLGDVMRQRFHSDVRIRAIESLLFERIPDVKLRQEEVETKLAAARPIPVEEPPEQTWNENTATPRVHLQGNGRYALMVTNSGGGYSRWNDIDITRWRSDTTRDSYGSFLYLRDWQSGATWAGAYQPLSGGIGTGSVSFSADHAEFHRRAFEIETTMDTTVAADDDVELRRVTVTNWSIRSRGIELTSYLELALAPHRTDAAHPAFAKMFVETECPAIGVLLAHRRPRSPEEAPVWAAHILTGATGSVQFETDRAAFLGRTRDATSPDALRRDLTSATGAVLDPIFSLRYRFSLRPRDRVQLSFLTMAAPSREAVLALVAKYQRAEAVTREFEMAWTRAQLEFRYLGIGPAAAHRFEELASHLLYPNWRLRPPSDRLARNRLGQAGLWPLGISGDLPLLLVTAAEARHLPLVRELLLAHTYWRLRGLRVDLIVLNQEDPSYDRPFHQQLQRLAEAHSTETGIDKPGGIFLPHWHSLPEEQRQLLFAASSVVLYGGRGSLQQQLGTPSERALPPAFVPAGGTQEVPSMPLPFLELPYFNGLGGFTADASEYAIYLKPGSQTPTPWVNVMANSSFGALVSESGLGFTWRGNSQANRLTPWNNDPVSDPQTEAIYLRDEESGAIWTPTPLPIREQDAYRARHGQGYTVFEHNSHAIGQELTVFVPVGEHGDGDPVKVMRLRLRNDSGRSRRLTVTFFAEWVLGGTREDQQCRVQTTYDETIGAVLAQQSWTGSYTGQIAFAAASPRAASFSGDRTQFLGRNGSSGRPAGLGRTRLDNRVGAGLDPAAILQVPVSLNAGERLEVTFLLGAGATPEVVRELVGRYQSPDEVEKALGATRGWWAAKLGALQVRTPILSTDFMLNRWLPYQTLSCRFWGRSGLYQSSGAFGFRDQLQDSLALLYMAPELTRSHILAAAARQFTEGDVQHWWHADSGMGVRTRCSDDLVWLPFTVVHYVAVTGDAAILDSEVSFLEGLPLGETEEDRVFVPAVSAHTASLFEHCVRALDRAWRLGAYGLPLIGTGDWNDGMNNVGVEGRGESVWLAWFLISTFESFARLAENRESCRPLADAWREKARHLAVSIEQAAWDGEWYLRGFFDDGSPLGSAKSAEARIDSLPQSWAVLCGKADPVRAQSAMEAAQRLLVKEKERLALLLTPPFNESRPHPGYIMGYPPGVRENGGQYTHGALWMAAAWARLGDGRAAVELLKMMNPVENARDPDSVEHYRGEPYVVAADVSSAPGKEGRSGWTWYTGSSGWMYRIWLEEVLGFRLRGDRLTIAPVIPDDWQGFEIHYRHRSATYQIEVRRRAGNDSRIVELDGRQTADSSIPLADDGRIHKVTVWISSPSPTSERRPVEASNTAS